MFMQLERVDVPTPPAPAILKPAIAGDCPHCGKAGSLELITGCNPHSEDYLMCAKCDSTFCLPEPAVKLAAEIIEPVNEILDLRFKLAQFPDYEFLADGTPVRTAVRLSGPEAKTGPITPARVTSKSRYFSLASTDGRVMITDSKLRSMIESGKSAPASFFTIDDFPNVRFDVTGAAHSTTRAVELDHKPLETANGTIRRYRLYSKSRDAYVWFTDAAARRYSEGRCSLTTAEVPEDCVRIGDEFPDFVVDVFSGQPYRVQSGRIAIYAPVKCSMRVDGKFHIQNYSGKRVLFTPKQLLDYVGLSTPPDPSGPPQSGN